MNGLSFSMINNYNELEENKSISTIRYYWILPPIILFPFYSITIK